ncbi:MAG: hypothetical protein R3C99_21395 [Pirellulaceae bacterium]|nr:hypothetical protein [Planctomycetales bacterium]MCA9206385.1 hypothetical protein [Planctomycetales bacterium]MCA9210583.1 hypothetical protein [Planctomycetales bacterium]MCA9223997.1 hypothetical protein [Planctomycetales bacterium]
MSRATYFVQECPTCGRMLQIRVEYLGKTMVCQHCRGEFDARDPATLPPAANLSNSMLLDRAEQLLGSGVDGRLRVS